jgi:hypothetical protein
MDKMRPLIALCFLIFLVSSCTRYAYYQNPMHTNTNGYKAVPLHSEGIKTATYAEGALTFGGANDHLSDGFSALLGGIHRSHNFGHFQAYYGLTGALGSYKVADVHQTNSSGRNTYFNHSLNDSLINSMAGHKFFGSWGANGGINVVWPFDNGIEWRVLGAEVSWNNEFGNYQRFREKLPDTAANMIDHHRQFLTIGISTSIAFPTSHGSAGFKWAIAGSPRIVKGYDKEGVPADYSSSYFSQTFHITNQRITAYVQWNIGFKAMGMQLGSNVYLGRLVNKKGR